MLMLVLMYLSTYLPRNRLLLLGSLIVTNKCHYVVTTSTATSPSSFSVSPSNADSKEDFPLPTGPTTATIDPLGMFILML